MFQGRDYSPTQLLDLCKVDGLQYANIDAMVVKVLAIVVTEKDEEKLREKLTNFIREIGRCVSIGGALERLHTIATLDDELQGGLDGLDALTYHLSGGSCTQGIAALQAVLKRFEDDKKKDALCSRTS